MSRIAWTRTALARTAEYVVLLVLVPPSPWLFALLAVVVSHHYDIVYRPRTRGRDVPGWLRIAAGGWGLRPLAIAAGVALDEATAAAAVLTVALAVLIAAETIVDIARTRAR